MRKFSIYLSICLFIYLSVLAENAFAQLQGRTEGRPFITNFTPIEYNGEGQNWDLIQDLDNVLCIANTGGFLTYDGVHWRKFQPDNSGMPLCFTMDNYGVIYAGGMGVIGYLSTTKDGSIQFESLMQYLPSDVSLNLIRSCLHHNGKIYFQNATHILIWDGTQFTVIKSPENINILLLVNDQILVNTFQNSYLVQDNEMIKYPIAHMPRNFRDIIVLENEEILICTYNYGLFVQSGQEIKEIIHPANEFLKENYIQSAKKLPDGNIAFATKKGGVLITDQTLQPRWRLNQETGLQDDDIKKVFVDHEGNLWTGNNRGISKTEYPISTTYFDVIANNLGTIEEIKEYKNELYLGAFMGTYKLIGLQTNMLLSQQCLPRFEPIAGSSVENFALGEINSHLLFGGTGGLKITNGNTYQLIDKSDSRKLITSDLHTNIVYEGHTSGVKILTFEKNKVVKTIDTNLPDHEFRGVAETNQGDLWVTTLINGVFFVKMDTELKPLFIKQYSTEDGLPSLRDNLVYKVDHQIYFTTQKGIYSFDSLTQRFVPNNIFGKIYADQSRFVYAFNSDGDKNVWINAFNKRETGHAVKQANGSYILDHMSFNAMNQMQVYDILAQSDGVVWFGGSDGLVRYQKPLFEKSESAFNAKIRKVVIGSDSVIYWGSGETLGRTIDATFRDIRFEVAGVTFEYPSLVEFQFQLIGNDNEWSLWQHEPFRIYTNLSKGAYAFNVRAKNAEGQISDIDSYEFFILPYWYETWWFSMAMIVAMGAFIYWVSNFLSHRKIVKKVEELEMIQRIEKAKDEEIIQEKKLGIAAIIQAQELERQRIAKDLHDGIVQEIGSNVIRWRNLFSGDKPDKTKASQLIDSLENSNRELRALSHQMMPKALSALGVIAALEGLLEGSLEPAQISYEFEHFGIEHRLAENIEITLYRISQELIQNVIKHSQATMVNAQLYQTGRDVHLIMEDNGVGMSSSTLTSGIGLHNIKSRLDMLHGTVNFEASPQNGTLVTIKIPLN